MPRSTHDAVPTSRNSASGTRASRDSNTRCTPACSTSAPGEDRARRAAEDAGYDVGDVRERATRDRLIEVHGRVGEPRVEAARDDGLSPLVERGRDPLHAETRGDVGRA